MSGKLVFVSGITGSGKTTLIRHALSCLDELSYLKTVTTRPKREEETDSFEYAFVSPNEYQQLRMNSDEWDHTDYLGYSYGADVAETRAKLIAGRNVICSIAPNKGVVDSMADLYGVKPATIWIDTPLAVAKSRIRQDDIRAKRQESQDSKKYFDFVFTPQGSLELDKKKFVELIVEVLAKNDHLNPTSC